MKLFLNNLSTQGGLLPVVRKDPPWLKMCGPDRDPIDDGIWPPPPGKILMDDPDLRMKPDGGF